MSFLIGLLSKFGLGWVVKWLTGGLFSSLTKVIILGATELISVLGIVLRWVVETFIKGVNHIIKSVPAVLVVLSLSWGSYGYARYVRPVEVKRIEVEAPSPENPTNRHHSPRSGGDFLEDIFGPWSLF